MIQNDQWIGFIAGANYFLLIEGYSGDQCDFTISVVPPMAVAASPVGPMGAVSGPPIACPGATAIYSVPSVSNAGSYTWTVPPGALVNGEPSGATFDAPEGNSVEITFGATGGQVCVEVSNACFQGGMSCRNVTVVPIPTTVLPKVTVCSEDAPYTLPWGQTVNISGTYFNTYSSAQGCDSVVQLQVMIKSPIITNLAPKTVCAGDCVMVCGQNFCTTGQYSRVCTSYQGCDSLVNFQLTVISPVADILGGGYLYADGDPSAQPVHGCGDDRCPGGCRRTDGAGYRRRPDLCGYQHYASNHYFRQSAHFFVDGASRIHQQPEQSNGVSSGQLHGHCDGRRHRLSGHCGRAGDRRNEPTNGGGHG